MNLMIETAALTAGDERLFRPGALYAMKRLTEAGHSMAITLNDLTNAQQELLENEQIAVSSDTDSHSTNIRHREGVLYVESSEDILAEANNWTELCEQFLFPRRTATHRRNTAETDITISLNLDGTGKANIDTGLKFFDHMLEQIARHGLVDLEISASGDLEVDEHHTIEDVAITLGETIDKALDNRIGIQRYGFVLPMDESLSTIAIDLSGRPWLEFEGTFKRDMVGDFPTEMVEHFFHSLAIHLKATIHLKVEGKNDHHKIEACFKGLARCMRAAFSRSERNRNILPSTKDLL